MWPGRLVGVGPRRAFWSQEGVWMLLRAMGAKESVGAEGTWKVNCKKDCELVPSILQINTCHYPSHYTDE